MMSHFRLVCCVIWTASLTYVTNGAPTAALSMLDRFIMDFEKCKMLDYFALPVFKPDNDASGSNTDPEGYDLSVPLETCATTLEDNTIIPICNEAFDMMYNLSTCRGDIEQLKKIIPSSFKTINITAQVDDVCEDFSSSKSILAQKEKYVAFKFADKAICPLVCREKVVKACAFLMWGYKVQAKINDALQSSVKPDQGVSAVVQDQGEPVSQDAESAKQNEKPLTGVGSLDVASQDEKSVDRTLAGKVPDHAQHGEHGISTSLTAPETSNGSPQSPVVSSRPSQLISDGLTKNMLKATEISERKSEVPVSPETESREEAGQKTKPENGVSPKPQANDRLPGKTSVSSTTATGRSATASSSGTSENGKGPHILDGHSEKDTPGMKAKVSTAESSANSLVNAEGKLHPDEMNEKNDNNNLNVGEDSKGKSISQSGSSVSEKDGVDKPLPDTPKASSGDQEYIDTVSLDRSAKGSAENGDKNDPPPDTENKSKPDAPMTGKKLNPGDSLNGKTVVTTVTKAAKSAPADSAPEGVLNTSDDDMGDKYQPQDDDDKDHEQIGGEIDDSHNADEQIDEEISDYGQNDPIPPISVNENPPPDLSKTKPDVDMVKKDENDKSEASNDANKPIVKTFDKINGGFPEQEDTHFFFYFVTIVIFAIGGYVLFHNKQKIFALIIEGRHERRRRSGASYRKLETK